MGKQRRPEGEDRQPNDAEREIIDLSEGRSAAEQAEDERLLAELDAALRANVRTLLRLATTIVHALGAPDGDDDAINRLIEISRTHAARLAPGDRRRLLREATLEAEAVARRLEALLAVTAGLTSEIAPSPPPSTESVPFDEFLRRVRKDTGVG